jgi:hypothetical protein
MAPLETQVVNRFLKQLRRGVASPEDADRTLGEVKDAVVNEQSAKPFPYRIMEGLSVIRAVTIGRTSADFSDVSLTSALVKKFTVFARL